MRASVQLGLLCLSLLISSLDGEEINPSSMQMPLKFDEDMEVSMQFQVADNEQESNLLSHDSDIIPVIFRVKRQDNGKKPKRKKPQRPGSFSTLALNLPTTRVKRQTDNTGKRRKKPRPGMHSLLAKVPSQVPAFSGKILTA